MTDDGLVVFEDTIFWDVTSCTVV